ncbi:hypothetical protein EC991_010802 [Linnemannia zychae]|nr:hypothetical protein EC991_010802 [Linnemannia zychae]
MQKRPSTPTVTPGHPQKAKRANDDEDEAQRSSQAEAEDCSSSKLDTNVPSGDASDLDMLLKERLTLLVFSGRPQLHEASAVDYIVSLRTSSEPTPNADEYLAYQQVVCPASPKQGITRAWGKMKKYFSNIEKTDHLLETLINVASLVAAFQGAPDFPSPASNTRTAPMPAPALPSPPFVASSRFPKTPSSRSRSTSISSGSNGIPTLSQVLSMNRLFQENYNSFRSSAWSLPSGAVLDERLREVVQCLTYESALHSFVIEDVDALLKLFDDPADQEAIKHTMITRKDERLTTLSPAEHNFLQQYIMSPNDLDEFLGTHGWRSVGDALQERPSEEFQKVAHNCITFVLLAYQQNRLAFSAHLSEAWFNTQLWGFLSTALSCCNTLEYKPGEVSSEASSRRRNKQRSQESRQYAGHKADGVVTASARALEICYMEAAKKDGGVNTTKCLNDTRKLCKLMKDAHDTIREQAKQDIRERLATFGLRISGPTMTIFTLRQRPGRFYQAAEEVVESFPPIWSDEEDTQVIIAVIAWILRLRKAVLAMVASVKTWVSSKGNENLGNHRDWMAPTMTSPCLLSTPVIPNQQIPPLVL